MTGEACAQDGRGVQLVAFAKELVLVDAIVRATLPHELELASGRTVGFVALKDERVGRPAPTADAEVRLGRKGDAYIEHVAEAAFQQGADTELSVGDVVGRFRREVPGRLALPGGSIVLGGPFDSRLTAGGTIRHGSINSVRWSLVVVGSVRDGTA